MSRKKICFIAQFPPPIHGLAKAVDTLYNSELQSEFDFEKVNITDNSNFIKNIIAITKSTADLFYFTISQTPNGNLRDLIILKLLSYQKKKCLVHLHGGYYRKLIENDIDSWQKNANYKAIREIEGAIVLTNSLVPIFRGILPNEKIFIIPNCVDDEFLMSDLEFDEKMCLYQNKEVVHVLYLSNFIKSKGYPEVLQMAKLEKERVIAGGKKKFHFNFAGDFFEKSERQFFENYVINNRLQEFITYHGIVSGQTKKKLLNLSDVFILLTRYPKEGLPISILEAMASGMVIITTDFAGIPDIIENKINGILVEANSSDIISQVYQEMFLLTDSQMQKIAYTNRNKCKQKYLQQQYVNGMKDLFIKI